MLTQATRGLSLECFSHSRPHSPILLAGGAFARESILVPRPRWLSNKNKAMGKRTCFSLQESTGTIWSMTWKLEVDKYLVMFVYRLFAYTCIIAGKSISKLVLYRLHL